MPANVEIKARVRAPDAFVRRLRALSDTPEELIPQTDTFFEAKSGRLKMRELKSGEAQLIYYRRIDQPGPKRSDYSIFVTKDPVGLKSVLGQALGVRGTVEKVRHLYLIGQTRVHFDEVKGLGDFMELEVVLEPGQSDQEGRRIAEELILELGIERRDLLETAYIDLLEQSA